MHTQQYEVLYIIFSDRMSITDDKNTNKQLYSKA